MCPKLGLHNISKNDSLHDLFIKKVSILLVDYLLIYDFQVLVVDRPSPPVGPLDVSDITPDTCTLSWKPPLDDGGSPITNYIVEKMDNVGVSLIHKSPLNFYFTKAFYGFCRLKRINIFGK